MKLKTAASLVLMLLAPLTGCSPETVDSSKIIIRDGLAYQINSETPFTGTSVAFYGNVQKSEERTYKDGKPVGTHRGWHENGQQAFEGTYSDGKIVGSHLTWYKNGQKGIERTYKDGYLDGPSTMWHENGQKWMVQIYRNGELVNKTEYDEAGKVLD